MLRTFSIYGRRLFIVRDINSGLMDAITNNSSRSHLGKKASDGVPPITKPRPQYQKKRHPLADATNLVNNQLPSEAQTLPLSTLSHHSSITAANRRRGLHQSSSPPPKIEDKRISAVSSEGNNSSVRYSQASNTSTNASGKGKRKVHVGPWRLGKTIGKGASGRVRKARHVFTGQDAAIKIVSKKAARFLKSSSLLSIDHSPVDGRKPIPFGIEREVVIMKMIEHPNIIRLFDIWENRGEL